MKNVHGGILICDVLFVPPAISTSVIDVFLGIEMADAGTHSFKTENLCRFCGNTASSKKTSASPKEKFKLEFERHGIAIEEDWILFQCLPDVRGFFFFAKILESKNKFPHIRDPEIFSGNAGQTRSVFWHTSRYIMILKCCWIQRVIDCHKSTS